MESGLACSIAGRGDGTDLEPFSNGWASDSSAQHVNGIIAAEMILESP